MQSLQTTNVHARKNTTRQIAMQLQSTPNPQKRCNNAKHKTTKHNPPQHSTTLHTFFCTHTHTLFSSNIMEHDVQNKPKRQCPSHVKGCMRRTGNNSGFSSGENSVKNAPVNFVRDQVSALKIRGTHFSSSALEHWFRNRIKQVVIVNNIYVDHAKQNTTLAPSMQQI